MSRQLNNITLQTLLDSPLIQEREVIFPLHFSCLYSALPVKAMRSSMATGIEFTLRIIVTTY